MVSLVNIDEMINNLPRLTPRWHGLKNSKMRGDSEHFVDFGGTGVDVILEENIFTCKETKYLIDQCNFSATSCSLPFLPANKVANKTDPCLASLYEAREKCQCFTSSLDKIRLRFNAKNCKKFKNSVLSTQKVIHKMSYDQKFEKVTVPESIARLALDFPETIVLPPINMTYAGGCLETSRSADKKQLLLHPSGEELNYLEVTLIEEATDLPDYFSPITSLEKNPVKLKGGRIFQISSSVEGYSYVRQNESCHFINFSDVENISHSRFLKKRKVTNIASSPHNPQDYIAIYDNGKLELKYLEESEAVWTLNKNEYSRYGSINAPHCNFGSHPMSILCQDEYEFCSFDTRSKQDSKKVLFSNSDSTCFLDETFVSLKNCVGNYFQHIVLSNYHLFLCDERYPKKPLLSYNHMLSSYPLYCTATTLSTSQDFSNVMILVGTQDTRELSAFSVKTQHSLVQPVSLSPPLHLSSFTDCVNSLRLHCIPVKDSLIQRFTYPLVGISALPHNNGSGFTAFQLNSLGDLFYQDFTKNPLRDNEKNCKVDLGCALTSPDRILSHMILFSRDIDENKECSEFNHPFSKELNVDLTKLFNAMKCVPVFCNVCNPDKDNALPHPEENQNNMCLSCNFTKEQSENLCSSVQNLNLLSGSVEEVPLLDFDTSAFYEFDDNLSQKLLAVWDKTIVESSDPKSDDDSSSVSSYCSSFVSDISYKTSHSEPEAENKLYFDPFKTENKTEYWETVDFVPPSQEVQPRIGETLRKLKKSKLSHKTSMGSGGF